MALRIFKLNEHAIIPKYATQQSAGFDLTACLEGVKSLKAYNLNNREIGVEVRQSPSENERGYITYFNMMPGIRVMVPTGIIFDMAATSMVNIYSRSGLSLKKGVVVVNGVGVIDSDYTDEVFVLVENVSDSAVRIEHGDRIAQAVEMQFKRSPLNVVEERPGPKGDRKGGMGSTGEK